MGRMDEADQAGKPGTNDPASVVKDALEQYPDLPDEEIVGVGPEDYILQRLNEAGYSVTKPAEPDYYVFDDGDEKPLIRRRGELDEGGDWEPLWLQPVAAESRLAVAGWAIVSDGPQGIDLNWDGVLYRDLAEAGRSLLEAREAFWAVLGAVMVTRDELRDGGYTEAEA